MIEPAQLRIHSNNSARSQMYIELLDRGVEYALTILDPETGMYGEVGERPDESWRNRDRNERKTIAGDSRYTWAYTRGRTSSAYLGAMAVAWSLKSSRYYQNRDVVRVFRQGLKSFCAAQDESGEFIFSPIRYSTCYGTHEMAWRLNPLLTGYVLMRSVFDSDDSRTFEDMLWRGAQFLLNKECNHRNNRGTVWTSVIATCAAIFENVEMMQAARNMWAYVSRDVHVGKGEIREGAAPDSNYSAVSLDFTLQYQLIAQDPEVEETIRNAVLWIIKQYDPNGIPYEGISTRKEKYTGDKLTEILPAIEYCAQNDSALQGLAQCFMNTVKDFPPDVFLRHGAWRWAKATEWCADPPFAPLHRWEPEIYWGHAAIYVPVRREYQTQITLRGRLPAKGIQNWTAGTARPLVSAYRGGFSRLEAWGFDSSAIDVRDERDYQLVSPANPNDPAILIYRQGVWRTLLIMTQKSSGLVWIGPPGHWRLSWCIAKEWGDAPVCNREQVQVPLSSARLVLPNGNLQLSEENGGWRVICLGNGPVVSTLMTTLCGQESASLHTDMICNKVEIILSEEGIDHRILFEFPINMDNRYAALGKLL